MLQSNGLIKFSEIRSELGVTGQAPFLLHAAENGTYGTINQCSTSKPDGTGSAEMYEWYSYNHTQACANRYVVQKCVGGISQGATYAMTSNDIVPVVGSFYKLHCIDIIVMDGNSCWEVISTTTDLEDGNGTFGTEYYDCNCGYTPPPPPPPPPTYYNYEGLLCGGSQLEYFRSTQSNLADLGVIVKAYSNLGGGSNQCFDNITPSIVVTTNDVISTHGSCVECNGTPPPPPPPPPPTPPGAPAKYSISSNTSYSNGCSGYYQNTTDLYTISLFDIDGNSTVADQLYTFTFLYDSNDVQDYGGGYQTGLSQDVVITSGNHSGSTSFTMKNYVSCNYSNNCDGSCYQEILNLSLTYVPEGLFPL
jgi:hypothetical protein